MKTPYAHSAYMRLSVFGNPNPENIRSFAAIGFRASNNPTANHSIIYCSGSQRDESSALPEIETRQVRGRPFITPPFKSALSDLQQIIVRCIIRAGPHVFGSFSLRGDEWSCAAPALDHNRTRICLHLFMSL